MQFSLYSLNNPIAHFETVEEIRKCIDSIHPKAVSFYHQGIGKAAREVATGKRGIFR